MGTKRPNNNLNTETLMHLLVNVSKEHKGLNFIPVLQHTLTALVSIVDNAQFIQSKMELTQTLTEEVPHRKNPRPGK